jgi:hypothetical protein
MLHRRIRIPWVPINSAFVICGRTFLRTEVHGAKCQAKDCSTRGGHIFKGKGYAGRQLEQHADACTRRESKPSAAELKVRQKDERDKLKASTLAKNGEEWLAAPARPVDVEFASGLFQTFHFQNAYIPGPSNLHEPKRGQHCEHPRCGDPIIKVLGDYHAIQHAKKYHPPVGAMKSQQQRFPPLNPLHSRTGPLNACAFCFCVTASASHAPLQATAQLQGSLGDLTGITLKDRQWPK